MPYVFNDAGEIEDVKGAHKAQFYVTDGKCQRPTIYYGGKTPNRPPPTSLRAPTCAHLWL